MATEAIEHFSFCESFNGLTERQLDIDSKRELSWECKFSTDFATYDSTKKIDRCVYLNWKFEWNEAKLKQEGYDGFEGELTGVYYQNSVKFSVPFNVELARSGQWVSRRIGTIACTADPRFSGPYFSMNTEFLLHKFNLKAKGMAYNTISTASKFYDAVLVVEDNKVGVSRNHLSMHSEYFDKLFNSDFKEKSMTEIPIEEVKYVDFARFLDAIHPTRPTYPTDETAEILLELADRFMVPAITSHVENHLIRYTRLPLKEVLLLADKYKLDKLLDLNLKLITTERHVRLLFHSVNCKELSESTRAKLLNCFDAIIRQTAAPI